MMMEWRWVEWVKVEAKLPNFSESFGGTIFLECGLRHSIFVCGIFALR